ncbi:MAG: ABC transporter permease [Kosmotogaceae bacterium]
MSIISFRRVIELTKKNFFILLRNKQSLISIMTLPIVIVIILGFVIAGLSGGTSAVRVKMGVHIPENLSSKYGDVIERAAKNTGINPILVNRPDEIRKMIVDGEIQIGVSASESEITFYYDQSFGQYNNYLMILQSLMADDISERLSGIPRFVGIEPIKVETGASLTVISFIVPGVVAVAIIMVGVYGMAITLATDKESEVIKRFIVTPLKGSEYVISIAINRYWPSLISTFLTLYVSGWIFSTSYDVRWIPFIIIITTGLILAFGIGTILSLAFKDLWTTMSFTTVILVIMMLFSNVYYPFSIMPNYMRVLSHLFPITYFAEGFRYSLGIEGMFISRFVIINLVFALCGFLLLFIGGKLFFRLEKK